MRWFVEVSRVGENSSDEKYCVEAKQWQAALQEARKLRGDSGPLSKFSIELLDNGYRAVDPKQKLRYVVAKAPADAPLTPAAADAVLRSEPRNGQQSLTPSAAPPAVALTPSAAPPAVALTPSAAPPAVALTPSAAPPAVALTPSAAPPAVALTPSAAPPAASLKPTASVPAPAAVAAILARSVAPTATPVAAASPTAEVVSPALGRAEPYAGVPSSALSPHAPPSAVHVTSRASAQPSPLTSAKAPSAFPPRPGSVRPPSAKAGGGLTVPLDAIPPAPAVPQGLGPAVPQQLTQPSPVMDLPPPATVLRKRQEEPTPETPITYREIAYVVEPGVTRGAVEALLWASFRDLSRELAERPGQKFVQLAVFDHRFERRPERPPLGTLAWKDWRGNPVLSFPFFDGTPHIRPSGAPPSIVPVPVVPITAGPSTPAAATAPPAAAEPAPSAAAPEPVVAEPPSLSPPEPVVAEPPSLSPPEPALIPPPPAAAPEPSVSAPAPGSESAPPAPSAEPSAAIPLTREKLSSYPPSGREKLSSQPSASRSSRPIMPAVRRRAGEELIAELFETLHDLHFLSGVADGAEFVLATLDSVLPCEGVLIHVFDINARQFVVVRAKGPGTMQVLLHRSPDSDEFIDAVMHCTGAVAIQDTQADARVLGPRWEALGVKPRRALCGPVRQGGRYLGLIEVVNPMGDEPFHPSEQNAVDYVCAQFADFLANRPIVLDADVILRR